MKEVGTFQFYKYICVNTQSSHTKTNHCSAPLGMKIFPNNFRPDFPQLKYNKRSSKTGSGGWLNLINCFKIILHRLTGARPDPPLGPAGFRCWQYWSGELGSWTLVSWLATTQVELQQWRVSSDLSSFRPDQSRQRLTERIIKGTMKPCVEF